MTTATITEELEPAIQTQTQEPALVRTWPFYLVWLDPDTGELVEQQWQPVAQATESNHLYETTTNKDIAA